MGHISLDGDCYKTTHAEWQFTLFVSVHNSQFSSHYPPPPFICSSLRVSTVSGFSLFSIVPSLAFLSKCGKQVLVSLQQWGVWRHNVSLGWKESRSAQTGTVHRDCVHVCVCVCVCYCCLVTYEMTISIDPLFLLRTTVGSLSFITCL